jgi:hypothetical protein
LRDTDNPFFINNETGNVSDKGENKVVTDEVAHAITIELYLYIHNQHNSVDYV